MFFVWFLWCAVSLSVDSSIVVGAEISGRVENLLVDKQRNDYMLIEENLWQVIERREENTLEQICNEHRKCLSENHFENFLDRNRVNVDIDLIGGLKVLNETTTNVFSILKFRDYGGLMRFAHSPLVRNITEAMQLVSRKTVSDELWKDLRDDATVCKHHYTLNYPSEHQNVVEAYKDVQHLMLRGYMCVQLAQMIMALRDREKHRGESKISRLAFIDHNQKFRESALSAIASTSRDIISCSPDNYLFESNDYEMITGFLQGFIDNEINLNPEMTCQRTCSDYQLTQQFGCHNDTLCAQPLKNTRLNRCAGYIRDCEFIGSDVEICPSIVDKKRYKYLIFDQENHFGESSGCQQSIESKSWTDWFVRCHNCFCICDESDPQSDRFFSLREVLSDIHANQIVTGIHLAKPDRIFELVISERKLLGHGRLKPTNNYFHFNYPSWKRSNPKIQLKDNDYHTLTYENRSVNFDTVTVPQGNVVTGVRFGLHNGHLRLEVRGTEFDFETGTLMNLEQSAWHANEFSGRHEIPLLNSRPTGLHGRPIINIIPDTFVKFTPSDKLSDASQTIIPFIETAKVEPIQPVPLSGVGLYYKGKKGHGGVIAPKLVVYNFELLI